MDTLKIPENHLGISKTLRLPEDLVKEMQALSTLKKTSLNQIAIQLMRYGLANLDPEDKKAISKKK